MGRQVRPATSLRIKDPRPPAALKIRGRPKCLSDGEETNQIWSSGGELEPSDEMPRRKSERARRRRRTGRRRRKRLSSPKCTEIEPSRRQRALRHSQDRTLVNSDAHNPDCERLPGEDGWSAGSEDEWHFPWESATSKSARGIRPQQHPVPRLVISPRSPATRLLPGNGAQEEISDIACLGPAQIGRTDFLDDDSFDEEELNLL